MPRSQRALHRIQNQELQSNAGSDPLKIAEIFRALTEGIFTEVASPPAAAVAPYGISTIRRNLQREYVKRLSTMVLGPKNDRFPWRLQLRRHARRLVVLSAGRQEPGDACTSTKSA